MVEPTEDRRVAEGKAVGRSLVAAGKEVMVLVANFSFEAREIPAGTKLRTCEEVMRQTEQREGGESAAVGPLPGHLHDLAPKSANNLAKAQA